MRNPNRQLFESISDRRNTHSLKWGKYDGSDIIPLWVCRYGSNLPRGYNAAVKAAEFGNFGYSHTPILWSIFSCKDLNIYHWEIQKNWIIWLPGMVCGLNVCCGLWKRFFPSFYPSSNLSSFSFSSGNLALLKNL